jgi:hypothetical protein
VLIKSDILVLVSVICRMMAANAQMDSRVMVSTNVKVRDISQGPLIFLEVVACPPRLLL